MTDSGTRTVSVRLCNLTAERLRIWARLAECRIADIVEAAFLEWAQARADQLAEVDNVVNVAQKIRAAEPEPEAVKEAPKKWSRVHPQEIQRMQALALSGLSVPQISRLVGRPYSTVLDALHRAGHVPPDARTSSAPDGTGGTK